MYVCSWMDSMPALYGSWTPDEFIEWFAEQDDDSMYNLNEPFLRELIIENRI
jgi:endo-beta-N-acetylglucosaminidase D